MVLGLSTLATHKTGVSPWAALAHRIAGEPRMRVSRDRDRKDFRQCDETRLTDEAPRLPAAVKIYNSRTGLARCLVFDFDCKNGNRDAVEYQVREIQGLLHRHGLKWVHDRSPSGGEHLYVPVEGGLTPDEAHDILQVLKHKYPTIDPQPHLVLKHGCIRVPGSAHKAGGHQELLNSVPRAINVLDNPAPRYAFDAFCAEAEKYRPAPSSVEEHDLEILEGDVSANADRIARTGTFDANRYRTPSDARFAVVVSASLRGFTATDIYARMNNGTWPGLASLFARYRRPFEALQRDVRKAQRIGGRGTERINVRENYTSQPLTQGGPRDVSSLGVYERLKLWRNAMMVAEMRRGLGTFALQRRLVLRALGEAAVKVNSTYVEFGVRSLSLGTALEASTVARHLRALAAEPEPLIVHRSPAQGTKADGYELVIPESLVEPATQVRYRKGRLHALRPVFRALGLPAAFLLERLEQGLATPTDLVACTGFGRVTVYEALRILAAYGLAAQDGGHWRALPHPSMETLGEQLGVIEQIMETAAKYRREREAWRSWLASRQSQQGYFPGPDDDYPFELFEPPVGPFEVPTAVPAGP